MKISETKLDNLYVRYGFKRIDLSDNARVYTYQGPYFHNAEIVPLISGCNLEPVQKKLENSGYSVRIQNLESLQQAEEHLFTGFFRKQPSRKRAKHAYDDFVEKRTQYLGFDYQYIPVPYINYRDADDKLTNPLVKRIVEIFDRPDPQLVFVDAPAGFGKTCTALEVLSSLLEYREDWIPVVTELSRNRQARLFRYVLLDEIDRSFNLRSALVEDEIKRGRIPLIIDGFDELLSRGSIDSESTSLDEAESMLDTIAGLLERNAKILVTTRRTAIFSGTPFDDWVDRLNSKTTVSRFQIQTPSLDDWIGKSRRTELEKHGVPVEHLSNPVLLSFLRRQAEESFKGLCKRPNEIVENYFEQILDREMHRQDLKMKPQEQLTILKKLATEMLDSDFTHESSGQVCH